MQRTARESVQLCCYLGALHDVPKSHRDERPGSELLAQWGNNLGERRAGETGTGSESPMLQAAGEASTLS